MIAALVAWVGLMASAAKDLAPEGDTSLAAVPSAEGSLLAGVTESAIEGAVETALGDDPASRVVARMAARPGQRLVALQGLLDHPDVQAVQDDAFLLDAGRERRRADRALNRMSFYRVAHDPELRATFADLGFVSEEASGDSNVFRAELRGVLDQVGSRIKGIKNDPEMQALARDPEIIGMLQSGDTIGLLRNERIRGLAARLAETGETGEGEAPGADVAARVRRGRRGVRPQRRSRRPSPPTSRTRAR